MIALRRPFSRTILLAAALAAAGCTLFSASPEPGPDKQWVGTVTGGALGAGAGAVTSFNLISNAGPGAWVGGGFGAVFGAFTGLGFDLIEENQITRLYEEEELRARAFVQELLAEHYQRRFELHPSRDIFPADWFFDGDEVELKPEAKILARELGVMTKRRMPWSRIIVAAYVTAADKDSTYAQYLTKRRAEEIALQFVKSGIEPRRVLTQGYTLMEPVLIDPDDDPSRYRQAIEIIPVDR